MRKKSKLMLFEPEYAEPSDKLTGAIALITGALLAAATFTVAVIALVDSAPLLSFATAVKALSVPLALAAGVQ